MKKILFAIVATLAYAVAAQADTIQLDETFTKANQWLKKENLSLTGSPSARDDAAAFMQETILFYGEGYGNPQHESPAQKEGMAKRAAVVSAQRAVAEYLEGFALASDTVVNQGVTVKDMVRSATAAYVKGVQVVFQDYSKEKDIAIAIVKIGMHGPDGFASHLYNKMNSDPAFKKAVATDKPVFRGDTVKLEQAYDGLIVDATEHQFRPALINRIFTQNGEVIYDPAKVSQKVLVEQGCGEYTNSVDKARAALEKRGVKNPLIIKASGATNFCDLQVSDNDAVTLFSANQKGNFLAAAKVAFVLK
ncbi:hypothetical protein OR1_01756 [Geobacter sp. OR-1]|uniref:hypothetical protein n=1 Tax=Geobacter sp. OR-1 TaxID=1266765 RepID=UPI000541E4A2|nr:hypothetical protein [Geobacter sp. OR-1]GAM09477.1 hypothetical protein OR1_01756 [Geobacter sp. OR-1]